MKRLSRAELLERLVAEGQLDPEQGRAAAEHLATQRSASDQPWFLKLLQGFGGWVASLVLLGGAFLMTAFDRSAALIIGLMILVFGTSVERRQSASTFTSQVCLSALLVGTGLTVWGFVSVFEDSLTFFGMTTALCMLLCVLVKGWVLRCLMALGAMTTMTVLVVAELESVIAWSVLFSLAAGGLVKFVICECSVRRRLGEFYGPLRAALTIFLLAGITTIDSIRDGGQPEDQLGLWVLSGALACMLVIALRHLLVDLEYPMASSLAYTLFGLALGISACLAMSPGTLASILLLVLAIRSRDRWSVGLSIVSLLWFGSRFYYALEFTFLMKSLALVLSGALMVFAASRLKLEETS